MSFTPAVGTSAGATHSGSHQQQVHALPTADKDTGVAQRKGLLDLHPLLDAGDLLADGADDANVMFGIVHGSLRKICFALLRQLDYLD